MPVRLVDTAKRRGADEGQRFMRILAPNLTTVATATPVPRRAGPSGFALSEDEETTTRSSVAAGGPRMVGGIDALMALQGVQGVEDPTERRKRAVKRGQIALDALEELKIGLLGGALSPAILAKLQSAAAHLKLGSGHAELDAVLSEIELRVAVEIAKMSPR